MTRPVRAIGGPLLEREEEREELELLVDEARSGEGRLVIVEGPAGLGKTRLVEEARRLAEAAGLTVLSARGGELERDFGFGIVRGLLEPTLARADSRRRKELLAGAARLAEPVFATAPGEVDAVPDPTHATLHGLYWLVANLSQGAPLLLAVDDLHWADVPSLRFLVHLARRLDGLRVALLVAMRSGEESSDRELVRQLALEARGPMVRPRRLSAAAVAELVRNELGCGARPELCAACHEATAGNPFLVSELVAELRSEGTPAEGISADAVRALGPERIAASLLMRVGRLDPAAPRFARAVAILGSEASLHDAAALAELEVTRARSVAAALAEAAVFEGGEPLRFIHPIAQTAIKEEMPEDARAALHLRAAELLARRGAEPSSIAVHLLGTDPRADEATVVTLVTAGRKALANGAPEIAARHLRRALSEPPPERARSEVVHLLGLAEMRRGDPAGVEHLREAADAAPDARTRAEVTRGLVGVLMPQGRFAEAAERLEKAASELDESERELRLQMEVEAASASRLTPETYAWGARRLRDLAATASADTPAGRSLLACLSYQRGFDGAPAREVAGLAKRALEGGLIREQGPGLAVWDALFALIVSDEVALAERYCRAALDAARADAFLAGVVVASSFTALLAYRQGQLGRAESEGRGALDAAAVSGYEMGIAGFAAAWLIDVLVDRGKLPEAEAVLAASGVGEEIPDSTLMNYLLWARGRLRLARGQADRGIADLKLFDQRADRVSDRKVLWRSRADLAPALARRGDLEEAQRLAEQDLELAGAWGTQRAMGVALRTRGLLEDGKTGIELLSEAVATLQSSEARLEHARALVDLGSALRRSGRTREGRARLAEGMDLAHACGATALVDRAHGELTVAGARPRRPALTGVDSLTPSERRVAAMAAEGMTNREIAQSLFVTLRTVEMHLSNTYRKLEIGSRRELPPAISGPWMRGE